jgi:hypothetical protein
MLTKGNGYTGISLGRRCEPAYQIKRSGFGRPGYPFDWILTDMKAVIQLIKCRFEHFMDLKDLDCRPPFIVNKRWGIDHLHDFDYKQGLSDYPEVKKKFDRKIKRFLDVLDSASKVIFFRTDATEEDMLTLDTVLQSNHPNLDYKLVMVNKGEDYKKFFERGRLSSYQLRKVDVWHGEVESWDRLFMDLPLLKESWSALPNLMKMLESDRDIDKVIKML